MTDPISFPPLLDLSSDELQMARERLISEITQRVMPSSALAQVFGRRALLAGGMAVTAAAAIALPIAFGISGASHHSALRPTAPSRPGQAAEPGRPNSVSVSTVDEANARLPFTAVLPSHVAPTGGIQVPIAGKPSDSSGWVQAHFDTDAGSYMLSEYTSDATVETLQHWAAQSAEICSDCAQQVVIQDGVHVLVLESPVFGLRLQWVRGDGTSPVLTELDWSRTMPGNNVIPSQEAALAIAGDIIRQGG